MEHPFKFLQIPITQDEKKIKEAWQTARQRMRYYENSSDPQERAAYQDLMKAHSILFNLDQREQIIKKATDDLKKMLRITLSGKNKLTQIDVDNLMSLAQDKNHNYLDKLLAEREVEKYLTENNIKIGEEIKPKEPLLVKNSKIEKLSDALKIFWSIPDSCCEEVKIIKKIGRFPKGIRDGNLIFSGQGQEFIDREVVAGTSYNYSIFSIFQGKESKGKIDLQGSFTPPITFNLAPIPGGNRIEWDSDSLIKEYILIHREDSPPDVKISLNNLHIISGKKIFQGNNNTNHLEYIDSDLNPDKIYFYTLIAKYAEGDYSQSGLLTGKPLKIVLPDSPRDLTIKAKNEKVELKWAPISDNSPVSYIVIRKEWCAPSSPEDGLKIYEGDEIDCVDEKFSKGVLYFYSVYSNLSGFTSRAGAVNKFFAILEVKINKIVVDEKVVQIDLGIDSSVSGVKAVRTQNRLPNGPDDNLSIQLQQFPMDVIFKRYILLPT